MAIQGSSRHLWMQVFLISIVGAMSMHASVTSEYQGGAASVAGSSSTSAANLQGTWSGTFISTDAQIPPLTIASCQSCACRTQMVTMSASGVPLNRSAGRRCETDNGTGTMGTR
jgi:hypothetical protein